MATRSGDDVVIRVTADTTGVVRNMRTGRERVVAETKTMQLSIGGLDKTFKQLGGSVGTFSDSLATLGVRGAGAVNQISASLGGVVSALAGGATAAALGTALVSVFQMAADAIVKHQAATQHMQALNDTLGITAGEVSALEAAFDKAGVSIDRLSAQQIAQLGKQAGLTSVEVADLAERIKTLATLEGIDPAAAASVYFREMGVQADALVHKLRAARKAIVEGVMDPMAQAATDAVGTYTERIANLEAKRAQEQAKVSRAWREAEIARKRFEAAGTSGFKREWEQAADKAQALSNNLRGVEASLREVKGEAKKVTDEFAAWEKARADKKAQEELERQRKQWAELARARKAATLETDLMAATVAHDSEGVAIAQLMIKLADLEERRVAGRISAEDAARQTKLLYAETDVAVETATKKILWAQTDAALQIAQTEANLTGNKIREIELRRDAEIKALERRKETEKEIADEISQMQVQAAERARREIERVHRDRQRSAIDFDIQTEAILAGVGEDRLARIRLQAQQELEAVRRLEQDKTITAQQAASRRAAIIADEQAQVARVTQQQTAEAMQAGAGIGQGILDGIKSVQQGDDWQSIFKSILQTIGSIVSLIPGGGQLAGLGMNLFAGFFADGGHIRGPGGPRSDRVIAAVSAGEYVAQAAAVDRFGVRFFDSLNAGVLDLSALPRFASGGLVGGARPSGPTGVGGGRGGGTVNVNIAAFDPTSAREAVRDVWEDAQYARGAARASAKATHGLRRQVAAPRPGR